MRRARRNSLLAAALLCLTAQAPPQFGREEAARRQVEEAERVRAAEIEAQSEANDLAAHAASEEKQLTSVQADALGRLKRAEAEVAKMTGHLAELARLRDEAQARIDKRAEALRPILPVIVRMARYPAETLLASQAPPEEAVRGVMVLRTLAHQAEVEARSLTRDRAALDAATRESAELVPKLAAAEAARAREADALTGKLAETRTRREEAEQAATDAARHAAAEAARAKSLRSMLSILETQRRLEEAQAREEGLRAEREQKTVAAEAARLRQAALGRPTGAGTLAANAKPAGQLLLPVAGTVVRGWGDQDDGETANGLTFRTEPGAAVLAPCGGNVAFAEPFRGYGLLLIIDCGGGYHAVMAGFDRLDVGPGRPILAGMTTGRMAAVTKSAGSAASAPLLYLELRKGGRPVNPTPWLKPAG